MEGFPGKLLGIDHGLKIIGLATCDPTGLIAAPYGILERKSKQEDFGYLNRVIAQERIVGIILGLPPRPPDFEGFAQADKVKNWAQYLLGAVSVPIHFWDEGLSSVDAETLLHMAGKRSTQRIDAYAATVILQSFLDALREGFPFPEPIEKALGE